MSVSKENLVTSSVILLVLVGGALYTSTVVKDKQIAALNNSEAGVSLAADEDVSPYTDLDGNAVSLADYVGDVLVVNSWASWCPFCDNELEKLSSIAGEFEKDDVRVLAINRAEPATTAQRFLLSVNAGENIQLILDNNDRYFRSIDGYTMPETVFYDREGNVVHHRHGELSVEEMRQLINEAIQISDSTEN